jgi:hypothetical protein
MSTGESAPNDASQAGPSTSLRAGDDPLIGQTLSHYRIVEKLGGGGPSFARRSEARASYGGSSVAKERICS